MGINGRMLMDPELHVLWNSQMPCSRYYRTYLQHKCRPTRRQRTFSGPFQNIHEGHVRESGAEHVKFADDGTVWESNKDPLVAVQVVCRKAQTWIDWWKMSVNFTKTEGRVFCIEQDGVPVFSLHIGNETIGYNPTPKIPGGITLDEKLTFNQHIDNTEKKASRALSHQRSERNR